MIVKKIGAWPRSDGRGAVRAGHVAHLLDYMNSPEKASAMKAYLIDYFRSRRISGFDGERLIHLGARNFVTNSFLGMRAEMMAIAQSAVRSPNPLDHWLLSWREGELPTAQEVDETVAIFVEHMKLGTHQCIYSVHGDTHNRHVHVAVNRYDPVAECMVSAGGGFAIEEAHKAVARITARFDWATERRALYVMKDDEPVLAAGIDADKSRRQRPLSPEANAFETRSGYRSRQRIAQEEAWPLIRDAGGWADLHARLASAGFDYVRAPTNNGAAVLVDEGGVKASQVHREATIKALEQRFGQPFAPRQPEVVVADRNTDRDVLPGAFRAEEYRKRRAEWEEVKGERGAARSRFRQQVREVDAAVAKLEKGLSSTPTEDEALLLEALRTIRQERAPPVRGGAPAQDLEQWLHDEGEAWFAERWRHRHDPAPEEWVIGGALRDGGSDPKIDEYVGHRCAEGIRYAKAGEGTAFIDRGDRITAVPGRNDRAVGTALRLASMKFEGALAVRGSPAFRKQCYRLAGDMGLSDHIAGDEFALWRAANDRQHGPPGAPSEPLKPRGMRPIWAIQDPRPTLVSDPGRGLSSIPTFRDAPALYRVPGLRSAKALPLDAEHLGFRTSEMDPPDVGSAPVPITLEIGSEADQTKPVEKPSSGKNLKIDELRSIVATRTPEEDLHGPYLPGRERPDAARLASLREQRRVVRAAAGSRKAQATADLRVSAFARLEAAGAIVKHDGRRYSVDVSSLYPAELRAFRNDVHDTDTQLRLAQLHAAQTRAVAGTMVVTEQPVPAAPAPVPDDQDVDAAMLQRALAARQGGRGK